MLPNKEVSHGRLIDLLKAADYNKNAPRGLCTGFSVMAIIAFLSGNLINYYQLLQYIFTTDDLVEKIRVVRKAIFDETYNKKMLNSALNEEEWQKIIDVIAFFDGITLLQQPELHEDLFGAMVKQASTEHIISFLCPAEIQKKQGIVKADAWHGVYSQNELKNYLKCLDAFAKNNHQSLAFNLLGPSHRISLCYDNNLRAWIIFDANQPYATYYEKELENIAEKICDQLCFTTTGAVNINSVAYCTFAQKEVLTSLLTALKQSADFQSVHAITKERSQYQTEDGDSLAHSAAEYGFVEDIFALAKVGADLSIMTSTDKTPAMTAAIYGNTPIITALAQAGQQQEGNALFYLNTVNAKGETVAHIATISGQADIIAILSKLNFNFNQITKQCETPALLATHLRQVNVIAELAKAGLAQKNDAGFFLQDTSEKAETLMHVAAFHNFVDILHELYKAGLDLNKATLSGKTPAMIATQMDHGEVITALIEWGLKNHHDAGYYLNTTRKNGKTLLHLAVEFERTKIIAELGRVGIDLNKADEDDMTPVYLAAQLDLPHIVDALLKAGADVNLPSQGETLATFAASQNNITLLKILAKHNVDFNKKSHNKTPFEIALLCRHTESTRFINLYLYKKHALRYLENELSRFTYLPGDHANEVMNIQRLLEKIRRIDQFDQPKTELQLTDLMNEVKTFFGREQKSGFFQDKMFRYFASCDKFKKTATNDTKVVTKTKKLSNG